MKNVKNLKIDSQKLTNMAYDYKVIDELLGTIIDCNRRLAKLADAHDKWHPQNGDFFFFVEKRNQSINEIVDILNEHAFTNKFAHVRIHKIDCLEILKELQTAIRSIREAITVATAMERMACIA